MKNPRWWLWPLALLYGFITEIRNYLFKISFFRKTSTRFFSIGVGNLQVGGTAKTPHIAYLANLLAENKKVIISRGYGRKTKNYLEVKASHLPTEVGDELYMLFHQALPSTRLVADANRVHAVKKLEASSSLSTIILFDDVYQHQSIRPTLQLLLTTYDELFSSDFMLPMGRLREFRRNANRANAIIVTKCNDVIDRKYIVEELKPYLQPSTPIFFSQLIYAPLRRFDNEVYQQLPDSFIAFSGIGRPHIFNQYVADNWPIDSVRNFADHYHYTRKDVDEMLRNFPNKAFITTEKDFVKLVYLLTDKEQSLFYYLPLEIKFAESSLSFDDYIRENLKKYHV